MMRQKNIFIALIVAFLLAASVAGTSQEKVRQAGVAGAFYPANPDELGKMVDGFLAKAQVPSINGPLIALIAPHAGYPFSGAVAGHSYAVLKNRKFRRVVIIAPSHYEAFPFSAVYDGGAGCAKLFHPVVGPWSRPFRRTVRTCSGSPASVLTADACAIPTGSHHHGRSELRGKSRARCGAC